MLIVIKVSNNTIFSSYCPSSEPKFKKMKLAVCPATQSTGLTYLYKIFYFKNMFLKIERYYISRDIIQIFNQLKNVLIGGILEFV